MRVRHRSIELALLTEDLHEALDAVVAGADARNARSEDLLAAMEADAPTVDFGDWRDEAQRDYRRESLAQPLYRALFVACWGSLEQMLSRICGDLQADLDLKLSERDLRKTGVQRSVDYLCKVAGLEVNLSEWGWDHVRRYGILRNHLVHDGESFSDAADPLQATRTFAKLPHLETEAVDEIILSEAFVRQAIRQFQHLLQGVLDNCPSPPENPGPTMTD